MFGRFLEPKYMPCPECGASVARAQADEHACDRERWLDYQLFLRRDEIERLGSELDTYFGSPEGRFEAWYAERERRRREREN